MGSPSYMRSVVDRNVVMRRKPVYRTQDPYHELISHNLCPCEVRATAENNTYHCICGAYAEAEETGEHRAKNKVV